MSLSPMLQLEYTTAHVAFAASVALYTTFFFTGRYMLQRKGLAPKEGEKVTSDKATRKMSWLITMAASGFMTVSSLPYVAQFVGSGFDVAKVGRHAVHSDVIAASFVAYLATDCVLGAIFYRKQLNLLTGWIHHIAYMCLCSHLIRREWSHIFCLSVLLELPTFHLALSYIDSRFRHDVLFTALFFLTRILFHIVLIFSYGSNYGRSFGTIAASQPVMTAQPAIFLSLALPLHVWWFTNSISGQIRRHRQVVAAAANSATGSAKPVRPSPLRRATSDPRIIGTWIVERLPVNANGPIMQRIRLRLRTVRRTGIERMRGLQREFEVARRQIAGGRNGNGAVRAQPQQRLRREPFERPSTPRQAQAAAFTSALESPRPIAAAA